MPCLYHHLLWRRAKVQHMPQQLIDARRTLHKCLHIHSYNTVIQCKFEHPIITHKFGVRRVWQVTTKWSLEAVCRFCQNCWALREPLFQCRPISRTLLLKYCFLIKHVACWLWMLINILGPQNPTIYWTYNDDHSVHWSTATSHIISLKFKSLLLRDYLPAMAQLQIHT